MSLIKGSCWTPWELLNPQQYLPQCPNCSFCRRNEAVLRVHLMSNLWVIFRIPFGNVFPLFWTGFILVWFTWPRTLTGWVPKLWHIYDFKMAAMGKMKKTSWLEVPVGHNELGYFRYIIWYMIGGSYEIKSHSRCSPSVSSFLQGPAYIIPFHQSKSCFAWFILFSHHSSLNAHTALV